METTEQCPTYHKAIDGMCVPIAISFKEWVVETGIGEGIVNHSWRPITYQEFSETIREVISDANLMRELREFHCKRLLALERGEEFQQKFNDKLEEYFK